MVLSTNTLRDSLAQKAAYLKAAHRMPQEEIGRILGGVSQAHVSRLLKRANEMGWLITEHRFIDKGVLPETLAEINQLLEPMELSNALKKVASINPPPKVQVFDSGSMSPTMAALIQRRKRFGRVAAGRLLELLKKSDVVGISWGRCVHNLIHGLTNTNQFSREKNPILFVPTCAELVALSMPEYSSTRLAEQLNDTINNGNGERLSLSGVPAYIPRRYKKKRARIIRQYVNDISSYKHIFNGDSAIVANMDTMITSIGSPNQPVGGCVSEIQNACGIDLERLQSLVIGDIGGILIARPSLSRADKKIVKQLNKAWTGISFKQLKNIVTRATHDETRPGIVVVAIGKDKAPALIEVIRNGLVNELMIDKDLEASLIELINC